MKTKNKKNPFRTSTICLAVLSTILLGAVIFLATRQPSVEDVKKAEAFETLAHRYIMSKWLIEGEQTPVYKGIGISEDDDLYIAFELNKLKDHTKIAKRNYRLYFQCKDEKTHHDEEPRCTIAGGADNWEDVPEDKK